MSPNRGPAGGPYYVESPTNQIEQEAHGLIQRIDGTGGMINAVESGYAVQLISDFAWEQQIRIENSDSIVVGVNEYIDEDETQDIEIDRPVAGAGASDAATRRGRPPSAERLSGAAVDHRRRIMGATGALTVGSRDLPCDGEPGVTTAGPPGYVE